MSDERRCYVCGKSKGTLVYLGNGIWRHGNHLRSRVLKRIDELREVMSREHVAVNEIVEREEAERVPKRKRKRAIPKGKAIPEHETGLAKGMCVCCGISIPEGKVFAEGHLQRVMEKFRRVLQGAIPEGELGEGLGKVYRVWKREGGSVRGIAERIVKEDQ